MQGRNNDDVEGDFSIGLVGIFRDFDYSATDTSFG
jgi:hypothetical protein